jgi:hypothetical protein
MKYQIRLRRDFLGRETTLDWHLSLEQSIVEAKRRLDWKAATSARVVDETGRDVWRSASGSRRKDLWLWGQATVAALGLAGLVVVGLLEGA